MRERKKIPRGRVWFWWAWQKPVANSLAWICYMGGGSSSNFHLSLLWTYCMPCHINIELACNHLITVHEIRVEFFPKRRGTKNVFDFDRFLSVVFLQLWITKWFYAKLQQIENRFHSLPKHRATTVKLSNLFPSTSDSQEWNSREIKQQQCWFAGYHCIIAWVKCWMLLRCEFSNILELFWWSVKTFEISKGAFASEWNGWEWKSSFPTRRSRLKKGWKSRLKAQLCLLRRCKTSIKNV